MGMKIYKKRSDLTPYLLAQRARKKSIGFVPTMGALHAGHISLIRRSREQNDLTVCSIFVNPTQFNDPADLEKYPRPIEHDIVMLAEAGCDILYLPEKEDVYPQDHQPTLDFDFGGLDKTLEGASRPGHFKGVAQVVAILLDITQPDRLYLGQKDYQQYLILSKLVKQLELKTKVVRCAIMREDNGLAMSSRNERVPSSLREQAGIIYKVLKAASKKMGNSTPANITKAARDTINQNKGFKVDYFEVLTADELAPIGKVKKNKNYVLITSVIVGGVRLLDNLIVKK